MGLPKTVNFSPVLRSVPSLRSGGQAVPEQPLDDETLAVYSGAVNQVAVVGKFYIVLGDSLLGYYLVKCESNYSEDTFTGKYFKLFSEHSESYPDRVMFKETKETDTFKNRTIVSEISVTLEVLGKKTLRFLVNKVDLDDSLMAISELCDI